MRPEAQKEASSPYAQPRHPNPERAAVHAAGHGLLLCLVYPPADAQQALTLHSLIADPMLGDTVFPLGEETTGNPWRNALVQLGGLAAEQVLYPEDTPVDFAQDADVARARRLLERHGCVQAAFVQARQLLEHHRDALDSLSQALQARGVLTGDQVWDLYARSVRCRRRLRADKATPDPGGYP